MSITTPAGFSAAATTAGIKASGKKDMALVVNNGPDYTAAGVFTRNRVVAAPVKLTRRAVADGQLRAVVYNPVTPTPATVHKAMLMLTTLQNSLRRFSTSRCPRLQSAPQA